MTDPIRPGLKRVSELYGRHPDSDIYVVGTGTSLRVFPTGFLDGKVTIGLNRAWTAFTPTYGITIHPELNIPEFMPGEEARAGITWITKREKMFNMPGDQIAWAEEHFHFFRTDGKPNTLTGDKSDSGRIVEWVRRPTEDFLYLWTSIAQPGVNLAANLGARNIVLVGCDNAALMGNHHVRGQHTMWLGESPDVRYREYYEGLAEMRTELRARGVNLVSVTPFLTLGPHEDEFRHLCHELGEVELVDSQDISETYVPPWQAGSRRSSPPLPLRATKAMRRRAGKLLRRS